MRTSSAEASGDRARHAGYVAALRAAGVEPMAPIAWEPGAAAPDELRGAGAPTAVVVWNDHGAIGLIDACEAGGISVPGALSVVGFDNIDIARLRRISLTTVAQPLDLQAEKAVTMLLDRIDAEPSGRPRHLSVPVELRVRASTAPAAGSAGP